MKERNSTTDIRWKQRFGNFCEALTQLKAAVELSRKRPLSDLEKQGLIKSFEFTFELGWQVLKDYFEFQGTTGLAGSRDAIREGFSKGLLSNGEVWMEMISSRNRTSHTYNNKIADEIYRSIVGSYHHQFEVFRETMVRLEKKQ